MIADATALTAEPPSYARDGKYGYFLKTATGRTGWIRVGDDGQTVNATLDRRPWCSVGRVDTRDELTPEWVAEHAGAILEQF